jgi:elongation factor G
MYAGDWLRRNRPRIAAFVRFRKLPPSALRQAYGCDVNRAAYGPQPCRSEVVSASLIEVTLEPKSALDADLLEAALIHLTTNDALLNSLRDKDSGMFMLGGMSEDHLDIAITRLRGSAGQFNVGAPQIAYREKLGCAARIEYIHKRILGPMGEFARVVIDFAPADLETGFRFQTTTTIPDEFLSGVEKALQAASQNGVLAGFPLIGFSATLVDAAYHDIDSSARAFQIAAQCAVRELKEKGNVQLTEPVMNVEVAAPEEFVGAIIADLRSRRGVIREQRTTDGAAIVEAAVPLANMFGYVNTLSFISQRRASHTMAFSEYRAVPLPDNNPPFPPAVGMRA